MRTSDRAQHANSEGIDDFGVGQSSLEYLHRLPAAEIKIDRSFIVGASSDAGSFAIVRTVVELVHTLGMVAVAEGVESQACLNTLRELGCDLAQGFHIARPMPAAQCAEWLCGSTRLSSRLSA